MRSQRLAESLAIAAVLGLAGCTSATTGGNLTQPPNSALPHDDGAGNVGLVVPEGRQSPLAEYTHLFFGTNLDEDQQRRQFEAMQVRRENLIAECMAELGFDYIPHLASVELEFGSSEEWNPNDPHWVSQWGYGIVNSPLPSGAEGSSFTLGGDDFGPNNQMLSELSATERAAWEDALWGESLGGDLNCFSRAWNQAWNEADITSSDEFSPLIDAINEFQLSLDQEVSDADQDWAICLANAGFPGFTRQADASASIWAERQQLINEITRDPEWVGEPTVSNSPLLAALQEREISLALADLSCRQTTNFQNRHDAHLNALEAQFVSDHQADLAALRAALEQRNP